MAGKKRGATPGQLPLVAAPKRRKGRLESACDKAIAAARTAGLLEDHHDGIVAAVRVQAQHVDDLMRAGDPVSYASKVLLELLTAARLVPEVTDSDDDDDSTDAGILEAIRQQAAARRDDVAAG